MPQKTLLKYINLQQNILSLNLLKENKIKSNIIEEYKRELVNELKIQEDELAATTNITRSELKNIGELIDEINCSIDKLLDKNEQDYTAEWTDELQRRTFSFTKECNSLLKKCNNKRKTSP